MLTALMLVLFNWMWKNELARLGGRWIEGIVSY